MTAVWFAILSTLLAVQGATAEVFLAGADLSHLKFFEDRGVHYRDAGKSADPLAILRDRGLNCVRLRLFTSSAAQAAADPYNSINNLEYTLRLAVRVKQAGLRFLLDFHYSDSWADPGKQTKPAAWANLTFDQLEQQVRDYSSNCIVAFKDAGAMPDYVQVGNEIIGGMLWPDGRVGGTYDTAPQWSKLGRLLRAAIRGVREAAGVSSPQILLHVDRGGDWAGTQWFFDHIIREQVEFDALGESYYPWWHGTLQALRQCLTHAAARYGKPIMLLETAFPWGNSGPTIGLPATPEGQVAYIVELAKILKGIAGDRGVGIFWWGTEYQRVSGVGLAGFDWRSFFGTDGQVLPVAGAFGQLTAGLYLDAVLDGDSVTLTWPLSGAGMDLMTSATLTSSTNWARVPDRAGNLGGTMTVTLPVDAAQSRFYRLQSN